jgi:plastocyanin
MRVPRFLIGVALVAAGIVVPSAISAPEPAPAGTVGMEHEKFTGPQTITIPRGGSVVFYNDSTWLHVIGPGERGQIAAEPGVPNLGERGLFTSESGDTFVSGPWNTPGTYHITCQLHQPMNLTIIVTE